VIGRLTISLLSFDRVIDDEVEIKLEAVFRGIFGDITARKMSLLYRWTLDNITDPSLIDYKDIKKYHIALGLLTDTAWDYLEQQGYSKDGGDGSDDQVQQPSLLHKTCAVEYAFNLMYHNLTRLQIEIKSLHYNRSMYGFDNR